MLIESMEMGKTSGRVNNVKGAEGGSEPGCTHRFRDGRRNRSRMKKAGGHFES